MATSPALNKQLSSGSPCVSLRQLSQEWLGPIEDLIELLPGAHFETSWRATDRDTTPDKLNVRIRFRPDLSVKAEFRSDGTADFTIPLCSVRPKFLGDVQNGSQIEALMSLTRIVTEEAYQHTATLTRHMLRIAGQM